jgi:ribosomal protein S18 acetylase RimI-like enzyme
MIINIKSLDYDNAELIDQILVWRNDIDTRKNSINSQEITICTLKNILNEYKNSGIGPYIINFDDINIGIVSFVKKEHIYIGINIDKNYRNKGIGSYVLKEIVTELNKSNIKEDIYAKIKKNNISSSKLFEKYFNFLTEDDEYYIYKYSFIEKINQF